MLRDGEVGSSAVSELGVHCEERKGRVRFRGTTKEEGGV